MSAVNRAPTDAEPPLCVDLDGTLTPVDTLEESALQLLRRHPAALPGAFAALLRGKAAFKNYLSAHTDFDSARLPLREDLLDWLRSQREGGRRLVLVTASTQPIAAAVAARTGLFDEVIASSASHNLSGRAKRDALVQRFGAQGFDYAANGRPDLKVWAAARRAIVVNASAGLRRRAEKLATVEREFSRPARLRPWLRALRPHQWVKNVLVFLPALFSHRWFEHDVVLGSLLAFACFCAAASSAYIINDLFDLDADRRHPRKQRRPFAAGQLSARQGLMMAALLIAAAIVMAGLAGLGLAAVLAAYYTVTVAYSLRLKRLPIVDLMVLTGLYSIRILAGAAATHIPASFWLLAFSTSFFLSLATVKRYIELDALQRRGGGAAAGRGYAVADLPIIGNLGTASALCSVVIFALYVQGAAAPQLYHRPWALWALGPVLLYWLTRLWFKAHRGELHDDPVVFALRDSTSRALGLVCLAVLWLAL